MNRKMEWGMVNEMVVMGMGKREWEVERWGDRGGDKEIVKWGMGW